MTLIYVLAAVLAVSVAETSDKKVYEDLEAMESMELQKENSDLIPAASAYNYISPSQRPPQNWNYVPNQPIPPSQNWNHPQADPIQPIYTHVPSVPVNPPYIPPVTASPPYIPPVTASPPYVPPVTASPPYVPPVQSDYIQHQNNYYPQQTWSPPQHVPTTTTPVSVIKNEQYYGENGSYKYEYQIADGTHVGEEGYYTDPKGTDESLVKKGWYSYRGADGKTYTVTYWADHTGFHAFGDHLPTPPPVPAAIQAALDKEEAEKNKQPVTYPPQTQKPYYPNYNQPQQTYYPAQPTYNPPQQPYYPPQQPTYGK